MPDQNEVGRAKIVVDVDASGVQQAVDDAKQSVEEMGDAAESTGSRVDGAFGRVGTKIEESTAGARKFTGAISGAIGAVTGLVSAFTILSTLIGALIALFSRKAERVEVLKESYESLRQEISDYSVDPLLDEYEKFERAANRQIDILLEEGKLLDIGAESLRKQAEEAANLRRELDKKSTSDETRTRRQAEELELIRKRGEIIRQINESTELQEIELLPTEERIRAEAERKKDAIRDAFSAFIPDEEAISKAFDAIDRATQKQIDAEIERQRIADEAQSRREAEADRRSRERAQREVDILREGLNGIFSADFTTRLDSIAQALKEGNNAVRRLK